MAEKKMTLQQTLNAINKKFGTGTIVKASEARSLVIRRVPTGSFALDVELGGGYPVGRIIAIAGAYSASKTTLALHAVRNFLLAFPNKNAVWEDAEGAFDPEWASAIVGEELLDRLILLQPKTSESGMDVADVLIRSGEVCLFVLDSLAATVPTAEVEGSVEDWTMGLAARLNGKFLRKAQAGLTVADLTDEEELPCTVLILNQLRDTMDKYKPEIMPGGRALGFFASIIIFLRVGERYKIKDSASGKEIVVGQEVKFKTEKNKTFPPFRTGSYDLYVDDRNVQGITPSQIDRLKEVMTYAIYWGVIQRRGAWYYIGEELKFQGGEALLEGLRTDVALQKRVEEQVMAIALQGKAKAQILPTETRKIDYETGEILE